MASRIVSYRIIMLCYVMRRAGPSATADRLSIATGARFTKHLTMNRKLFMGKIHVQNRNIVGDSVRKLACDIPERNFSMF